MTRVPFCTRRQYREHGIRILEAETLCIRRESFMLEFFAYETLRTADSPEPGAISRLAITSLRLLPRQA